ncbi:hypothetical protein MKW98_008702 [Papaver atlanticum]|uniref:Pentatricopeptide repeat-containing protein n=1 Tax=Papaver atlanticum TaxID=357466 RepID=A0AAD4XWD6_9MAGN|nr:hypothetical protein MKW98_008702 [Papaver atlanticum]
MRIPATICPGSISQNWKQWIKESTLQGQWREVLSHYHEIRRIGIPIRDSSLFPSILKCCTNLNNFKYGTSIHSCIIKHGFESFSSVGNSTMDFYIKSGFMNSGLTVFSLMENKDSVTWNVVIHGCFDKKKSSKYEGLKFFKQAKAEEFKPNISTLVLVLQALRDFSDTSLGFCFHGFLIRSGFLDFISVQNSLMSLYVEHGEMVCAKMLFDEMSDRDCITWSAMIGGFVKTGDGYFALQLFREMFGVEGVEPDELTVVSILKACSQEKDIDIGKLVHCYVVKKGFGVDVYVGNSLIDMYSKCSHANMAFEVFKEMPGRNIVSWNSILSGFVQNELYAKAVTLFGSMQKEGVEADEVTLVNLLQSCKHLVDIGKCKSIHSRVIRMGFVFNELVVNSLIDAYAKCDLVELGQKLFNGMERRDMISWSTMITAFSNAGKTDEALNLFREMILVKEKFNSVTILSLLEVCAISAELKRCKWAHGLAIRSGFASEVAVATALLDMYSKCGEIDLSRRVFDKTPDRNIVSWSAMIGAYGMNGRARDALDLFSEMEIHGLKPNAVTILCLLSACSHGGLVEEGKSLFNRLISSDHGFEPNSVHYSCMVDMLGRAGIVESAMDMIKKMPQRFNDRASIWGALLSACRNSSNSKVGEGAISKVLELEPTSSAGYLLGSSMYAANGLWKEAANMRRLVKEKGVKVVSGYSLIHVDNKACRFVARDGYHEKSQEIYSMVEELHSCMRMKEERNDVFI